MPDKPRLKYEKPVSIDMGRVAPILGDTCSVGNGASDCPSGMNNAVVAICEPSGSGADNDCRTGSSAGTFCWPTGFSAQVYCFSGSGFGMQAAPDEIQSDSIDVGRTESSVPQLDSSEPEPIRFEPDTGGTAFPGTEPDAGGGAFPGTEPDAGGGAFPGTESDTGGTAFP